MFKNFWKYQQVYGIVKGITEKITKNINFLFYKTFVGISERCDALFTYSFKILFSIFF